MELDFTRLKRAFDYTSYEYLNEQAPDILLAIDELVKAGATPQQIRLNVQRWVAVDRNAIVLRCEAAARHIASQSVR